MAILLLSISLPSGLVAVGACALFLVLLFLLSGVVGPMPRYGISGSADISPNTSDKFLGVLEALTDAKVNRVGNLEVLTDGPCFYPAAIAAIGSAQQSICLEAYIFQRSEIGQLYLEALTERARAGLQVNLLLDAFGSMGATKAYFKPLLEAGGKVEWFNKPRWYSLTRLGNRTHRELLIVDGRVSFIGGAGVADQWFTGSGKSPRWRDTMVRVEGEPVVHLLATFAENWLTSHGELLAGSCYFPDQTCANTVLTMVVNSTPTPGGATRARVLFQMLLASAERSISITTPYFLPDKGLVRELCRAVERGVRVRILVPGHSSDHLLTRSTSRGGYGPLLRAGAEVYEYQPAMIHAKILVVDELWAVVGSTNFDNRSFGINDEVNLAVRDQHFAGRLDYDMAHDVTASRRVSLDEWEHRSMMDRSLELLGWIFERQQ